MADELVKGKINNQVYFCGEIISDIAYSHSDKNGEYWKCKVKNIRASGVADILYVTLPTSLLTDNIKQGAVICVLGRFQGRTQITERPKVAWSILVEKILEKPISNNSNQIAIYGYLKRDPLYRVTKGGRRITELLLEVYRDEYKSDNIPIILWGGTAQFALKLEEGDELVVFGRIQSREYKLADGVGGFQAYEVAGSHIFFMKNSGDENKKAYREELLKFPLYK